MNLLVVAVVVLFLCAGLLHFRRKYSNFPSGPYGFPILGYLPFVRKNAHKVIANLAKKYGSVFSLSFGTTDIVFVNDYETINEVLVKKGDVFSGRPRQFVFEAVADGKAVSITDGPEWREMRRFLLRHLRDFGVGKTSLESVIVVEVDKVSEYFQENSGNVLGFEEVFVIPILNIIWSITADTTFQVDDSRMIKFKDDFETLMENLTSSSILNCFPLLRFIMPKLSGYEALCKSNRNITDYLRSVVHGRIKEAMRGQGNDMMDILLEETERRRGNDGEEVPPFTSEHMIQNLKTLFVAGTDTTVTLLKWCFLMMALQQDVQRKVQEELDSNIGDSVPSWSQKNLLPYTEATILEIQRYFTIAPLSMPHTAMTTTTLAGYTIPKGTCVITNLWAMHFDPKYWEEPDEFRPERFIGEDGRIKRIDWFMPFSAGPRFCLGEPIARLEIFMFFTSLMQKFRFEYEPNGSRPSLEPVEGIVLAPKPFSLRVTRRNN